MGVPAFSEQSLLTGKSMKKAPIAQQPPVASS